MPFNYTLQYDDCSLCHSPWHGADDCTVTHTCLECRAPLEDGDEYGCDAHYCRLCGGGALIAHRCWSCMDED